MTGEAATTAAYLDLAFQAAIHTKLLCVLYDVYSSYFVYCHQLGILLTSQTGNRARFSYMLTYLPQLTQGKRIYIDVVSN